MSWGWSHTEEAYAAAYANLHRLDYDTLCVIIAEWDTVIFNEGDHLDGYYDKRLAMYRKSTVLTREMLADEVWLLCSESQEINGSWFGQTCDNGGFNARVCPHGCHTVPFSEPSLEWALCDDGTVDTVIELWCRECGKSHEERYSDTSCYRDESGTLDRNAFNEVIQDDEFVCPYCGEYC